MLLQGLHRLSRGHLERDMKVPVRLRRVERQKQARALLLPSHDAGLVLRILADLHVASMPRIFLVRDGLLLYWSVPLVEVPTGVMRLAEIGPNLLLPVDAELVPGLLGDEAAALGRKRGFVFLPGSRVLSFDPAEPLGYSQLLEANWLGSQRNWQPLPKARPLA